MGFVLNFLGSLEQEANRVVVWRGQDARAIGISFERSTILFEAFQARPRQTNALDVLVQIALRIAESEFILILIRERDRENKYRITSLRRMASLMFSASL